MRTSLYNLLSCMILATVLLLTGCAGQTDPNRVQLNPDGTMVDTRRNLMWQQGRSEVQFENGTEAASYAENLTLGGFNDWRLPTSQELWELYFANDFTMAGRLAKEIEMDGSYWTQDGDLIQAGYLEDGDDPGINRYFRDSDKGFVRAVRQPR